MSKSKNRYYIIIGGKIGQKWLTDLGTNLLPVKSPDTIETWSSFNAYVVDIKKLRKSYPIWPYLCRIWNMTQQEVRAQLRVNRGLTIDASIATLVRLERLPIPNETDEEANSFPPNT